MTRTGGLSAMAAAAVCLVALSCSPSLAAKTPRLVFSNASSPSHDAALALLEKEGKDAGGADFTIDPKKLTLAEVDTDFDGTPELFAFALNTDHFCGDAGCVPRLYRRDGDGWRQIDIGLNDFVNGDPGDWSLARKPENGHVVFVLQESHFSARFAWDGKAYSQK